MAESHKDAAVDFLALVAAGKVREAYEKHVGAGFRHHNPNFRGDAASLMEAMEHSAVKNPNKLLEIQFAMGEGIALPFFRACDKTHKTEAEPSSTSFALKKIASSNCGTLDRLYPSSLSMKTACSRTKAALARRNQPVAACYATRREWRTL